MRCACIDIGSNTTRILVAEVDADGQLRPVLERKAYTELGRDLRATGTVSARRLRALATVVTDYRETARELGVRRLRVVATAAIRGADNREDVRARLRADADTDVDVLAGEEEARLAFLGATRMLGRAPAGPLAVVDVGGGSSEIAVGTLAAGVAFSCSLAIGSSYLAEAVACADPPTPANLAAMRRHAAEALEGCHAPEAAEAVAVGGSATSVLRMGGPVLDAEVLGRAATMICDGPADVVAPRLGLDPERVRLLPAGILILDAVVRRLGCALQVGRGGLREGVCLDLAGQDPD
jgi:exopolyphosphatase/guanosine-5'-triphosphate,3'-diphosphate pyrophosphatase